MAEPYILGHVRSVYALQPQLSYEPIRECIVDDCEPPPQDPTQDFAQSQPSQPPSDTTQRPAETGERLLTELVQTQSTTKVFIEPEGDT